MKYDDRLATILAIRPDGAHDRAVRWRQLVDLVARAGEAASGPMIDAAIDAIRADRQQVLPSVRAATARAIAGRLLPPALLTVFAGDDLEVAAPLLTTSAPDQALIAAASPDVLNFLKALHPSIAAPQPQPPLELGPTTDASVVPSIRELLDRLEKLSAQRTEVPGGEPSREEPQKTAISDLAFRPSTVPLPVPPMAVPRAPAEGESPALFRWECGPGGDIGWVEGAPRGALVGRSIARATPDEGVDHEVERAFARRTPFRDATLALPDAGVVGGRWLISGVPAFAQGDGRFVGYRGIARREEALAPPVVPAALGPLDPAALRELVHEIKTPLNAIIGFAEIIDGQYLGPAQSGYRARAAEIAVQARTLLGGVDDLDFAARLRGRNPSDIEPTDFADFFGSFVDTLLADARAAGVTLTVIATPPRGTCTLDRHLAERLLERFTAAVLGAATTGESLHLAVSREQGFCAIRLSRPRAFEGLSDTALLGGTGAGSDFSWRMFAGLAQILGGRLATDGDDLVLRMPIASRQAI